jgi:hypothetical protein
MKPAQAEALETRVSMSAKRPEYKSLARAMLPAVREYFRNPENERAFKEWQKKKTAERYQHSAEKGAIAL